MSRNGSGTYTLPAGNPVVTGTTIASTWANNTLSDIATALTGSLASDGQTSMSGNLNLNSNKIVNLATPTLSTDAVTKAYADALVSGAGSFTTLTVTGTTTLATSLTGVLKGTSGVVAVATAGTEYVAPATATNFTAQQYFGNVALTDAATIAWAANTAQVATFTFVSNNRTMGAPTGLVNGAYYGLAVIQNAGSNTLTWNAVFKWAGGTAPTLSTGASAKDYFVFRSDGTNLYEQGRSLGVA
jgi:hypothetical protein